MLENQSFIEPSLFGVSIQSNSIYCGIHLAKVTLPEQCAFLGILRAGQIIPLQSNPEIYAGDYILAIALNPMMVPALKVTLKKIHSVYYSLSNCLLEARPHYISNYSRDFN
ncbi:TrkA C-terminal domain-containing protein [Nostoc spongiaeforme FACHB-130]|uniref:TrkA C-terminal domain-containing protein n=1 Tax=Nostoc spongiaeforme FACHB-130 TaxID=1357510 RepID=A0ABR8FWU7_9NOSO|nr:TrkA C-terminal domain-containing protein [Nostoc spongiaeforme]MBD2594820.1 TrkA C-terminal domain-containing protein [Nostoc spongiaeforme FACHB-130]